MRVAFINCPLCEETSNPFGTADAKLNRMWRPSLPETLEWMRCTVCGHVHTKYYWTENGLSEVFLQSHENQVANPLTLPKKIHVNQHPNGATR